MCPLVLMLGLFSLSSIMINYCIEGLASTVYCGERHLKITNFNLDLIQV